MIDKSNTYTNPLVQSDGVYQKVPITRFTEGGTITEIPEEGIKVITSFIAEINA